MKVAVVIDKGLYSGGEFQQELSTVMILNKYKDRHYDFLFVTTKKENLEILRTYGVDADLLRCNLMDRIFDRLYHLRSGIPTPDSYVSPLDKFLIKKGIDLVYFLSPSPLCLKLRAHNYIFTVMDLCHRDFNEFPEVNFYNEFEAREYLYTRALPKSVSIIVDSLLSRDNVVFRYCVDEKRVHIVPFLPSIAVRVGNGSDSTIRMMDVKMQYAIPGDYIYYPAQFWSHKNHIYILDALKVLMNRGIKIHAVFSGSDKGNLGFVLRKAEELEIKELIHYIGFVESDQIPSLYAQAIALVMPTFFGPTNIPPLEAFAVGCPVCYSDLPGLREQVSDAAFLMNLEDPESLASILEQILHDGELVTAKVRKGELLLGQWTEEEYWKGIKGVLDSYARFLRCWR